MSRSSAFAHSFIAACGAALFFAAILLTPLSAQQPVAVPKLVKFSGTVSGAPAGTVSVIFALYKDQSGGAPLWQEMQNVTVDASGHYTLLLGAHSSAGFYYQTWNGSAWVAMKTQPNAVTFSFANYMARYAWAFPTAPTHVSIFLGTNDFFSAGSATSANLSAFVADVNAIVASIHAYSSSAKVIVQVPSGGSSQDGFGAVYGASGVSDSYLSFRKNMQALAAAIFANFDTPAMNTANTYVVSHLTDIDPVYGWGTTAIQPTKFSTGITVPTDINSVHPVGGVGYLQMGDQVAATIQATR